MAGRQHSAGKRNEEFAALTPRPNRFCLAQQSKARGGSPSLPAPAARAGAPRPRRDAREEGLREGPGAGDRGGVAAGDGGCSRCPVAGWMEHPILGVARNCYGMQSPTQGLWGGRVGPPAEGSQGRVPPTRPGHTRGSGGSPGKAAG